MRLDLTYGTYRVLRDAAYDGDMPTIINSARVLRHLLDEPECRAACWLEEQGITAAMVSETLKSELAEGEETDAFETFRCFLEGEFIQVGPFTASLAETIEAAVQRCHLDAAQSSLATEHLLFALTLSRDATARFLAAHNIAPVSLYNRIMNASDVAIALGEPESIPMEAPEPEIPVRQTLSLDFAVYRILDAAANRAMEAIRVIEDYARFVQDDRAMSENVKGLRHDLSMTLQNIPEHARLTLRDTLGDVGTMIAGEREYQRNSSADVLKANFSRFQESLRSLEEYGKIVEPSFAREIEQIRYRSYTLQKTMFRAGFARSLLESAKLYVLVDGGNSEEALTSLVRAVIDGGADLIQLRDKRLDDRTLWERARLVRKMTQKTETLFIMNDRPDIAKLVRADGVHVGQEELPLREVRSLVGPDMLIGVSTHSLAQAQEAAEIGADYIGVGPVFPSQTKSFATFPGLELLREVAGKITIPAFAIGGIAMQNLADVCAAGIGRVAVRALVVDAANPEQAVRELKSFLEYWCSQKN